MIRTLKAGRTREVLSLITNVTYASVPCWYDASRRDLKMDLIVPKHRKGHSPCPAVLWICGGAWRVVNRAVWLPELVRLARAGFAVASIEYRTSNEAVFPAQLQDAKAAVRFLRAHAEEFCLDPSRFFAMGESAGGTLASLLGTTGDDRTLDTGDNPDQSSRVQGVVDFYGVTDLTASSARKDRENAPAASGNDVPYFTFEEFLGVGYGKEEAERASAVCHVSESTPPFLILHGSEDTVVPLSQSEKMYRALSEKNIPCDLLILEGAGHGDERFYQDSPMDDVLSFLRGLS